jgi:hypothetical protein
VTSAHGEWMAAWAEVEAVEDERERNHLLDLLRTVSGELKIGTQADPETRRKAVAGIRNVRREAKRLVES